MKHVVHLINEKHKTETMCGRAARAVVSTSNREAATCRLCKGVRRPSQLESYPSNWPGFPNRCEVVVRGSNGLELCGRQPCEVHAR